MHGVWFDEFARTTFYVDGRVSPPRIVYCYGGDHEWTGVYEGWYFDGRQYCARFRWLSGEFSGYAVLQVESQDVMNGGWWYEHEVPRQYVSRLPFLAGMTPSRWRRATDLRVWPDWAVAALGMPGRKVNASDLLEEEPPPPIALPATVATTSELRYKRRVALWSEAGSISRRVAGALVHRGWWWVHNLVAHPLLALWPGRTAVALHDWTSRGLNRDPTLAASDVPQISERLWWWVHNLVAHPAIAVVPCAATFRWHDATARRMRVPGWA